MTLRICMIILAITTVQTVTSQIQMNENYTQINRNSAEVGVADVDQDGHVDILISNSEQRWYAGPDFTTSYIIGFSDGGPYAARAADINNDGHVDFITSDGTRTADEMPGKIYAYINPSDTGSVYNEWPRIVVYDGAVRHQNDMRIVDVDGDGLFDIIEKTWSSERVVIAFQNPDILNWTVRVFDTGETGKPEGISAGDIDGDGNTEIVLSGVYWDNTGDWRLDDPDEYLIDQNFVQEEVKSEVVDINNDGMNDVYMGSAEGNNIYIAWYENMGVDGTGAVQFTKHLIKDNWGKCHMVDWIDIDNDGDMDLCTGKSFGENGCLIYLNENLGASWTEINYDSDGEIYTGVVADLDGDNDYDIVGPYKFNKQVRYYLNETPGSPPSTPGNLQANLVDGILVTLSWEDTLSTESSFEIERYQQGWHPLAVVMENETSFIDSNAVAGTRYIYRMRAANSVGFSEYIESDSIDTWPLATPIEINPIGGDYLLPPTISISNGGAGVIYYTINGSIPDTNSIEYTIPFEVGTSTIVRAVNTGDMMINSEVKEVYYNVAVDGNFPPIAVAGEDVAYTQLDSFLLSGDNSTDADDLQQDLQFNWNQISGPELGISTPNSSNTFCQPSSSGIYKVVLSVSDEAITSTDTIEISVTDLDEDLIAYWPLNDNNGNTAIELVNGNNGTLSGATTWKPAGKISYAIENDGVSGRIQSPPIDIPGNEMTICMWIKLNDLSNPEGRLISKANGTSSNNHYWMVSQISTTGLRFRLKTSESTATTTLASPDGQLDVGKWHFVCAQYNGDSMKIFNDLNLVALTAKTGSISQDTTVPVAISNQPILGGDRPFSGLIDDVRIYNRALSLTQLQTIYEASCNSLEVMENQMINSSMQVVAKDKIELRNITIRNNSILTLFSDDVQINFDVVVENGSDIFIQPFTSCND